MKLTIYALAFFSIIAMPCLGQLKPFEQVTYHSKRMNFVFKQPIGFNEYSRADTVLWPGKVSSLLNAISYKIK